MHSSALAEHDPKPIDRSYTFRAKELYIISAPIILEQIFTTLLGMVNTIMASSIDEYALPAVGMIDSISNIIIALFAALTTGGTIVVAQYIGREDKKKATLASAQAVLLSAVLAVAILLIIILFKYQIIGLLYQDAEEAVLKAALTYLTIIVFSFPAIALTQTVFGVLRGTGDTGTPMKITFVMNIFNVILGFILIKGLYIDFFGLFEIQMNGHGVAGAAIALLLARIIGGLLSMYFVVFRGKLIRLNRLIYFKPNFSIQKTVLGFGIPTSIESCLFQAGRLITQIFVVGMGTAAISANVVGSSIFGFINVPGNAFSTGVMILVGQRIGRGQIDDVEKTTNFAVALGMIMMAIICVICFPLTGVLIKIYNMTPESGKYLRQVLYAGYIVTPILWSLSFIVPAALRATGDVKFTMVVAIASMWIFRIASGFMIGVVLGFGVVGVWIGMFIDWFVRGGMFYMRLKHGKWKDKALRD